MKKIFLSIGFALIIVIGCCLNFTLTTNDSSLKSIRIMATASAECTAHYQNWACVTLADGSKGCLAVESDTVFYCDD